MAYGLFVPFGAFDAQPGRTRIPAVEEFYQNAGQALEPTFQNAVDAAIAHTLQFHLMWAF